MNDGRGSYRVLHLLLFSNHAKAFVQVSVEDLYPLLLELPDYLFTLRVFIDLTGIEALTAAAHSEQVWFV